MENQFLYKIRKEIYYIEKFELLKSFIAFHKKMNIKCAFSSDIYTWDEELQRYVCPGRCRHPRNGPKGYSDYSLPNLPRASANCNYQSGENTHAAAERESNARHAARKEREREIREHDDEIIHDMRLRLNYFVGEMRECFNTKSHTINFTEVDRPTLDKIIVGLTDIEHYMNNRAGDLVIKKQDCLRGVGHELIFAHECKEFEICYSYIRSARELERIYCGYDCVDEIAKKYGNMEKPKGVFVYADQKILASDLESLQKIRDLIANNKKDFLEKDEYIATINRVMCRLTREKIIEKTPETKFSRAKAHMRSIVGRCVDLYVEKNAAEIKKKFSREPKKLSTVIHDKFEDNYKNTLYYGPYVVWTSVDIIADNEEKISIDFKDILNNLSGVIPVELKYAYEAQFKAKKIDSLNLYFAYIVGGMEANSIWVEYEKITKNIIEAGEDALLQIDNIIAKFETVDTCDVKKKEEYTGYLRDVAAKIKTRINTQKAKIAIVKIRSLVVQEFIKFESGLEGFMLICEGERLLETIDSLRRRFTGATSGNPEAQRMIREELGLSEKRVREAIEREREKTVGTKKKIKCSLQKLFNISVSEPKNAKEVRRPFDMTPNVKLEPVAWFCGKAQKVRNPRAEEATKLMVSVAMRYAKSYFAAHIGGSASLTPLYYEIEIDYNLSEIDWDGDIFDLDRCSELINIALFRRKGDFLHPVKRTTLKDILDQQPNSALLCGRKKFSIERLKRLNTTLCCTSMYRKILKIDSESVILVNSFTKGGGSIHEIISDCKEYLSKIKKMKKKLAKLDTKDLPIGDLRKKIEEVSERVKKTLLEQKVKLRILEIRDAAEHRIILRDDLDLSEIRVRVNEFKESVDSIEKTLETSGFPKEFVAKMKQYLFYVKSRVNNAIKKRAS